jgi:surface antigen
MRFVKQVERAPGGRGRRRGLAVAGVGLVALTALVLPSAEAMPVCGDPGNACPQGPKTADGTVNVNAGYTLSVRDAPNSGAAKVRKLKDGAKVTIVCQIVGEQTSGTYGTSRLWDKLIKGGYVSDTYIYTGSDGRVAPECPDAGPDQPKPAAHPLDPSKGRPRDVTLTDDYPFPNASPHDADPWGFYNRECPSFVAFRLNRMKNFTFGNRMDGGHFGDAGHWDDNARALGFKVDNNPTVGSVMVRDSGTWGHVAIVAKVTKTQFMVEEYNHDVDHGYGTRWISRAPNVNWDHFIHFRF